MRAIVLAFAVTAFGCDTSAGEELQVDLGPSLAAEVLRNPCFDTNVCTYDILISGTITFCYNPPIEDGTLCSGNGGVCQNGVCVECASPIQNCTTSDDCYFDPCVQSTCVDGYCQSIPYEYGSLCFGVDVNGVFVGECGFCTCNR